MKWGSCTVDIILRFVHSWCTMTWGPCTVDLILRFVHNQTTMAWGTCICCSILCYELYKLVVGVKLGDCYMTTVYEDACWDWRQLMLHNYIILSPSWEQGPGSNVQNVPGMSPGSTQLTRQAHTVTATLTMLHAGPAHRILHSVQGWVTEYSTLYRTGSQNIALCLGLDHRL